MLWIVRKIFQRLLLGCNWILFDFITTYSVSVSLYSALTSLFQLTFILFTFTLPRSALYIFCSIRVFFTDTDDSQGSRGREGTIFYLTLPLSPAHEHWDIYLQLCMWDDYNVIFNRNVYVYQTAPDCYAMRFTTVSNYHLSDWLMMQCLFVYLMNWY